MNKFNQVRKQKNADDEQAEMFADTYTFFHAQDLKQQRLGYSSRLIIF